MAEDKWRSGHLVSRIDFQPLLSTTLINSIDSRRGDGLGWWGSRRGRGMVEESRVILVAVMGRIGKSVGCCWVDVGA